MNTTEQLAVVRIGSVKAHLTILEQQFACGGPIPADMTQWMLEQVRSGIAAADCIIADIHEEFAEAAQSSQESL